MACQLRSPCSDKGMGREQGFDMISNIPNLHGMVAPAIQTTGINSSTFTIYEFMTYSASGVSRQCYQHSK